MAEHTEQDWVEQAKSGEPAAIAELYQRYRLAARAAAYGVTGDLSLAEDATRFLDVPTGTLKRRLHDGRKRLRAAAERILEGSRPMSDEYEQILRQLREAADEGLDSEAFYQVIRKATSFGPVPREVLGDIVKHHFAARMPKEGPTMTPEREEMIRRSLREYHDPSERAQDPDHPVGATANAIRDALPGFQPWQVDVPKIDLNAAARRLFDDRTHAMSYLLPPDFTRESQGAYVTAERSLLIEDEDGSVVTMGELIARETTQETFRGQLKKGGCMSDTLGLLWKQAGSLDLQTVEELLRRLAEQVVPKTSVRFCPYDEPRYRAALRIQLGDNPIPAAIGGVHNRWSILPEGIQVASVTIYLEPWTSARTGQVVELIRGTFFPSLNRPDKPVT